MKWFVANIESLALENHNFRQVLYTSERSQLVIMSLKPHEEIGMEVHTDNDQFIRCEHGSGICLIDGHQYDIKDGFAIVIPAGAQHNIINTSLVADLKLYTLYTPPHHKDGIIHITKHDAEVSEEEFDGKTSE